MQPADAERIATQLLQGQLVERDPFRLGQALAAIESGQVAADADACARGVETLLNGRQLQPAARLGAFGGTRFATHPGLQRRRAQALIDLGDLDQGEALVEQALQAIAPGHPERAELVGLRGRAAKQRWVRARQADGSGGEAELQRALQAYAELARSKPWQGINTVALAVQAEKRGLQVPEAWAPLAAQILKDCVARWRRDEADYRGFNMATAAEAALALGKLGDAELWAYRFALSGEAEPFSLNSLARQLREVWQVPRTPSGRAGGQRERMLLALERALAQRSGVFTVPGGGEDLAAAYLEKVYSSERYVGYARWRDALQACEGVARIEGASGAGVGTGFVLRGADLHARLGDAPVLLTNAHVISDEGVEGALPSAEARVRFEVQARADPQYVPLTVAEVLWSSPPAEIGDRSCADDRFDVTLCRLGGPRLPARTLTLATRVPQVSAQSRAYVIGHPDGDGLQFSVADSELLAASADGKLVHYRTPTVGGSSGSPVFNAEWKVYAIHHAGSDQAPSLTGGSPGPANEGIALNAIRARLAQLWGS